MTHCKHLFKQSKDCLADSKIDISFIIDSSSSIGSTNFDLIKKFVINVINKFTIGQDKAQVMTNCNSISMTHCLITGGAIALQQRSSSSLLVRHI